MGWGTEVVGEALHMENTFTSCTCLLILSTAVKMSITEGTLDIYRGCVGTTLMGEGS